VLGAYTHGATLCCLQQFEPGDVLKLVSQERISVLSGVPTMYNAVIHHPDRVHHYCSSLRTGIAAGAPCPAPLMREIDEVLGCRGIGVAYGLTEASPGVSGSRPEDGFDQRCHTVGRPLPGTRVRIVDPETQAELPAGTEGEVQVAGYNVMVGYHDEPEATAAALTPEGWLRTGDLGCYGDDGCLRITGRIKDIIIRGGENIAPAEIESLLRAHDDVVDAAVVGVPHDHFGEEVAAALILKEGAALDADTLAAGLEGHIAGFKIPKIWKQVDAFPLTGSGKVKKFLLREMFADEQAAAG
jgi:fatty-acyl-CoA synthase